MEGESPTFGCYMCACTCIIEINTDEVVYNLIINVSGFTLRRISNTKENIVISIEIQVLPLGCSLQTSTEPVIML